ncbi:hypothetical protein DFR58_13019 [Anaerobacterium chartisolvens]|uniref:Uncharacterized protein n=1 Tax=Anaerobacterium chartisolvens TaxID=1297424 RepID=A0A369AMS3_9FIRM|nr:hypothetical protein [Anaerobacterium chartisolvens]RCX10353.1 hypothetical protein DFR58_13019 [Anaerobacterium chartisolvens]
MLFKKSLLKKACMLLTLVMIITFSSIGAFAVTDTKTVTENTYVQYAGTDVQADQFINQIFPNISKTRNYNDGVYSGTLNYSRYYVSSKTLIQGTSNIYIWSWAFVYTGEVTAELPDTKTVTELQHMAYGGRDGEAATFLSSILAVRPQTINYNDGTYSGTLSYTRYYLESKTLIQGTSDVYIWKWAFVYEGTVTYTG